MNRERITLPQFHARLVDQGVAGKLDLAFVCPICSTVQSARTLIAVGAGNTFDDVEGVIGFSCVGRWTKAGPHPRGGQPGRGCDWSLGGLFSLHELEVDTPDGIRATFRPATAEEAQGLTARQGFLVDRERAA
ncbi:hypothetical protein BH11PSE1_BH11PSE1_10520 [soil metagenome]